MTNFVSRPIIGLGTFIAEYTTNPMLIVSIVSAVNVLATLYVREPEDGQEAQIIPDEKVYDSFRCDSDLSSSRSEAERNKYSEYSDDEDSKFR